MKFEWDDHKNDINVGKHGVGFETAIRIFDGPVFSAVDERFDYGEVRTNSIGVVDEVAVLVVTHTERSGRIRIISARPAKRAERIRYEQALRQEIELSRTGRADR